MQSVKKQISTVTRNDKFLSLSATKQKQIILAIKRGRVYLSAKSNGSLDVAGLHYTINHTGKMRDVVSVSTSVLENPICQKRRLNTESICAHCFSAAQMDMYKNMAPVFAENLNILSSRLLSENEIPVILPASGLLRGESFGDVCTVIQAANYLRIAAANPWTHFAVWTKNPAFYHAAIAGGYAKKSSNCNIILSSCKVNQPDRVPAKYTYFIDRIFTVYSPAYIQENNININCGARSCATCKKCYIKSSNLFEINEKLK